jgi:hypothetical protein
MYQEEQAEESSRDPGKQDNSVTPACVWEVLVIGRFHIARKDEASNEPPGTSQDCEDSINDLASSAAVAGDELCREEGRGRNM